MDNITFKHVRYIGAALISSLGAIAGAALSESSQKRMVDSMNEYNDPKQQIKRLRNAGINPAYLLGQGTQSLSGIQSSPATGVNFDFVSPAIQAEAIKSQADLNKATAEKVRSETQLNQKDLAFRDALNNGQLDFLDAQTQSYLKGLELSDSQIKNLSAEYDKLISQIDEIKANTDVLAANARKVDAETALAELRKELERRLAESNLEVNQAQIRELASAAYGNIQRGNFEALSADYQRIVNRYANKNLQIAQTHAQYEAQAANNRSRLSAAQVKTQELQNERISSGQGVATFPIISGMREYFGAIGSVFGGVSSVAAAAIK